MLIGDQGPQLILGRRLLINDLFQLLKRPLYLCGPIPVLGDELLVSQLVHLLLDQLQNSIDLLDQIHFLNHLSIFQFLNLQLLLDLFYLSLLVQLVFIGAVNLASFSPLLSIQF